MSISSVRLSVWQTGEHYGIGGTIPILFLVQAVLFLHLLWCCWVLFGWMVTRCRPVLRTLHIASLVYAIAVQTVPWLPCPLNLAETGLETRAEIEPARGPFLVRVLDAVVYLDLPEWVMGGGAVLVCAAILGMYLRRYHRRNADGKWGSGIGVDMQGRIDTERLILEFDITNEELANAANITLYTASRILSAWQRTDAIRKQRRKIVVRSTERLFLRVAGTEVSAG